MEFRAVRPAGHAPKLRLSDKNLTLILPALVMTYSGLDPKEKINVLYAVENKKAALKVQRASAGGGHWSIKSFKSAVFQIVVPELAAKVTGAPGDRELKYQKVDDGLILDLPEPLSLIDNFVIEPA
jgi:hypothetical protein